MKGQLPFTLISFEEKPRGEKKLSLLPYVKRSGLLIFDLIICIYYSR